MIKSILMLMSLADQILCRIKLSENINNIPEHDIFVEFIHTIVTQNLLECDPVLIPSSSIEGTQKDLQLQGVLSYDPYIYGFLNKNDFETYEDTRKCYLFILWSEFTDELFSMMRELKERKLLHPEQYYIFYSENDHFKPGFFSISGNWSLVKNSQNALIIKNHKFRSKSTGNLREKLTIYKYNLFETETEFQMVAEWRKGPVSKNIFDTNFSNFNGHLLRITILSYFPYTTIISHPNGSKSYSGAEVEILNTISEYLNFRLTFSSPKDGQWGVINPTTGNWTGMISEVIAGKADIAIGGIAVSYIRWTVIDFMCAFITILYYICLMSVQYNSLYSRCSCTPPLQGVL